jgi:hypothetical protein
MTYLRIFLAAFMTMQFVLVPLEVKSSTWFMRVGGKALEMTEGYSVRIVKKNGAKTAVVLDKTGRRVRDIIIEKSTRAELMKHSPKELAKKLRAGMAGAGRIVSQQTLRFPNEAFKFFLAIGAVNAAQLIFDYSTNPVLMEQHLDAQKDPIGHIGFYGFLISAGLISEPLLAMINEAGKSGQISPILSHRLSLFIPYLSMTVGMMASNVIHEVGHFPHFKECIAEKVRLGNYEGDICDKAYRAWVDYSVEDKVDEWVPMLMSMLMSNLIQSVLHMLVLEAATTVIYQTVRAVGVQVLTAFVPGGILVKGAKVATYLGGVLQFSIFVGLDLLTIRLFQMPYANFFEGANLRELDNLMLKKIAQSKDNYWQPTHSQNCWKPTDEYMNSLYEGGSDAMEAHKKACKEDLVTLMQTFSKEIGKFRELNMQDILISQSNWSNYLSQVSGQYRAAKSFYFDFLGEIWEKQHGRYKDYVRLIDRPLPLFGVLPKNLNSDRQDAFRTQPDQVEEMQLQTVREKTMAALAQLNSHALQHSNLNTQTITFLRNLIAPLQTSNAMESGKILEDINKYLGIKRPRKVMPVEGIQFLRAFRTSMGDPKPQFYPGIGYFDAYMKNPNSAQISEGVPFQNYFGTLRTSTLPESLVASMVMGPELRNGENLIHERGGHKAVFKAPRIVKDQGLRLFPSLISEMPESYDFSPIVHTPFRVHGPQERMGETPQVEGRSVYQYLTAGNIDSNILNADENSVLNWWTSQIETQFVGAWMDYEQKFSDIIVRLVRQLWRNETTFIRNGVTTTNGDSIWNRGEVSNSAMVSLRQERQLYLLILGELFRDIGARAGTLQSQVSPTPNPAINHHPAYETTLMQLLRENHSLDFSSLVNQTNLRGKVRVGWQMNNSNLNWQNLVVSKFTALENEIRKIQVKRVQLNGRKTEVTVTTASNETLKTLTEDLKQTLNLLGFALGMKVPEAEEAALAEQGVTRLATATEYQNVVIQTAIQGLTKIAEQMQNFGTIANTASYRENVGRDGVINNPRCIGLQNIGPQIPASLRAQMSQGCNEAQVLN